MSDQEIEEIPQQEQSSDNQDDNDPQINIDAEAEDQEDFKQQEAFQDQRRMTQSFQQLESPSKLKNLDESRKDSDNKSRKSRMPSAMHRNQSLTNEELLGLIQSKSGTLSQGSKRDGFRNSIINTSQTSSQKGIEEIKTEEKNIEKGTNKANLFNPGMSKGPNAPFPSIDQLVKEIKPDMWNNIPVPVCEAFGQFVNCLVDIKKNIHHNFNENLQI